MESLDTYLQKNDFTKVNRLDSLKVTAKNENDKRYFLAEGSFGLHISGAGFTEQMWQQLAGAIGQNTIGQLNVLYLARNTFSRLEINDFPNLTFLNVARNWKLTHLNIQNTPQLTAVHAANCPNLSTFTMSGRFEQLEKLEIYGGQLKKLQLPPLPKLRYLHIAANKISDLSPIASYLLTPNVLFFLEGNPLRNPSMEVIKQGNEALMNWLSRTKKDRQVKLNEVRVILLGWGDAGKTSLLRRLLGNTPEVGDSGATEGINLVKWHLPETNTVVNLWDFGGQEMKHHTHQFFVSEDCIYVVVLDNRENEQAEYWLEYIRTVAGATSPTLLVYNKADESPNHHNTAALKQKYPFIDGGTETIIAKPKTLKREHKKYYEAFDSFKDDLVRLVENHRFVTSSTYSEHYIEVKKQIQEKTGEHSYIKLSEYRGYCQDETLVTPKEQEDWLEILRKLGAISYFGDNYFNNDLLILQPEWLTFAVYRIILHHEVKEKEGVIKLKDFGRLLEQDDNNKEIFKRKYCYDQEDYEYIATMMEKYKICYRDAKDRNTLIIPTGFKSDFVSQYENLPEPCLRFEFSFKKFLPPSLFFSLVTELFAYGWIIERWETGISLHDSENGLKALIKVEKYTRKITLKIGGKMPQSLLSIVRAIVKKLVKELSEVVWEEMEEMIPIPNKIDSYISYRTILKRLAKTERTVQDADGDDYRISDLLQTIETTQETNKNMADIKIDIKNENNNTNTNNNTINLQGAPIDDLRDLLVELEDAVGDNRAWQDNFMKALKDLQALENAQTLPEQKESASRLKLFFKKAKDVKDWTAITLLPAEIATKGAKMLEMGKALLEQFQMNF